MFACDRHENELYFFKKSMHSLDIFKDYTAPDIN